MGMREDEQIEIQIEDDSLIMAITELDMMSEKLKTEYDELKKEVRPKILRLKKIEIERELKKDKFFLTIFENYENMDEATPLKYEKRGHDYYVVSLSKEEIEREMEERMPSNPDAMFAYLMKKLLGGNLLK